MGDGHYFERVPTAPSKPRRIRLPLPDATVELTTDSGVFSPDAVDPGTRVLLAEGPPPPPVGHLLDLGCGYGPIALTLARRAPGATVWAVDVNERAVALCRANAAALGLPNVHAVTPAELPADVAFAAVWSNPPVRVGKAQLHGLLAGHLRRLAPGGTAWLVVHKHLGADSLQRWLGEQGWPTRRALSRLGYRLLEVQAAAPAAAAAGEP